MRDINPGYGGAPEHRSIRNVQVGGRRTHQEHEEHHVPQSRPPRRRGRGRFWLIATGVVILCAIAGVLLSTTFAGATVTVHPRQVVVQAPRSIEAKLTAAVGELEYRTISSTREASLTVDAEGTKQVSRQASGPVTISNTFSAEPQRLIANTRFEAPDGKIYRIRDSVTIPGMVGSKAGTIVSVVYADSPGASYNKTGAIGFTVPGFKNDPRYEGITAQSQGPISGGFVGEEPAVSDEDLAEAKTRLTEQLESEATTALNQSIPEGYGLLPGTVKVTYSEIAQVAEGDSRAKLTQSATAQGAIVQGSAMGTAIARLQVQGYKGEAVALIPDNLTVSASSTEEGIIEISMQGEAGLVWQFDPVAVQQALLGKSKKDFQDIVGSFAPAIECTDARPCDARLRPFWSGNFPSNPDKIEVVIGN